MSTANIPILYIHKGYCPYLRLSLLQARKSNPGSELVLLGDKDNQRLQTELGISFYRYADFFSDAEAFEKIYRHHSSNGYPYEVFCFQRWFVLQNFVARQKIDGAFFYNDSDTYLFCDASRLVNRLSQQYDLSICGPLAPCFVFFKHRRVLDEYCAFITLHYTDVKRYRFLLRHYTDQQAGRMGKLHRLFETISDMTTLGLFLIEHPSRVVDLSNPALVKDGLFEENHYLGFHREYQPRFPVGRKIKWRNGRPHYVTPQSDLVPVLGFHFQGHAKREMFRIFRGERKAIPQSEAWMHQKKYVRFLLSVCKKKVQALIPNHA